MKDVRVIMPKENKTGFTKTKIIVTAVIAVLALSVIFSSFVVIPPGHTGVTVTLGKVSEEVLQEGFHLKLPFLQEIVQIDNRVVKLEVSTEAFSKDLQTISVTVAVNYRITKSMSYSIYKEVGSDFESVLVVPAVNEVLKAVVAEYTASDLVASRRHVSILLDEQMGDKLEARGIFIEDLNIIDWDFSPEYIAAVEAKQVAEQNLIKTRTEQEQQIVIAETDAKKQIILAEAEASRIAIEAEAQAEANKLISDSLTELVLRNIMLDRWDGKLPQVTGGGQPLFDMGPLD